MGPPSQVEPRPAGERPGIPRSLFNETLVAFKSEAERLVRKISNNFCALALVAAPQCARYTFGEANGGSAEYLYPR